MSCTKGYAGRFCNYCEFLLCKMSFQENLLFFFIEFHSLSILIESYRSSHCNAHGMQISIHILNVYIFAKIIFIAYRFFLILFIRLFLLFVCFVLFFLFCICLFRLGWGGFYSFLFLFNALFS